MVDIVRISLSNVISCLLTAFPSNPIQDATDSTLACNDDGQPGPLQLTATVAAGSSITAYWNAVWPHPYGPMVSSLCVLAEFHDLSIMRYRLPTWRNVLDPLAMEWSPAVLNGFVNS